MHSYEDKFKIADSKLDEIVAELSGSVERIEDETKKIGEVVAAGIPLVLRQGVLRELPYVNYRGELWSVEASWRNTLLLITRHSNSNNYGKGLGVASGMLLRFAQFDGQYKELLRSQEEMDQGQVDDKETCCELTNLLGC